MADKGDAESQYQYGCLLKEGLEIPQDLEGEAHYFKLSPDQNYLDGVIAYATLLKDGTGVEKMQKDKPMNKLINFLKKCKETNDIDIDEMMKYPYLFFNAFFWGIKTIHPNSLKLIPLKFPNYEILK